MLIFLLHGRKHEHEESGYADSAVSNSGYLMWLGGASFSQALAC
jgi:hypothetical protein